jgi:hypothetical protein
MKAVLGAFLLAMPLVAQAAPPAQYMIDGKLMVHGKMVANPRLTTLAGKRAEAVTFGDNSQKMLTFGVVPSDFTNKRIKNGIKLQMDLAYKGSKDTLVAKPTMVLAPGEQGSVKFGKSAAHPDAELLVTARKIKPTPKP